MERDSNNELFGLNFFKHMNKNNNVQQAIDNGTENNSRESSDIAEYPFDTSSEV